jgi:hypothetical protein
MFGETPHNGNRMVCIRRGTMVMLDRSGGIGLRVVSDCAVAQRTG